MKTSKSILLVEDDRDDHAFFIEAIRTIENATLYYIAANGKEALEKLESSALLPDLIFMDINMPVMDGIECLAEIGKSSRVRNIPVVMLTTDTSRMDLIQKLGAKAFIKKPGNINTLHGQLEEMINLDFIVDSHIGYKTFQTAGSGF